MDNIFETASRRKVRFATAKGALTVEDLWDLPLTSETGKANLDDIARTLYKELRDSDDNVSFVTKKSEGADTDAYLKFDVVRHIIDVRLAENSAALKAKANAEHKQRLLAIIDKKQDEALQSKSIDELRAEIAAL